MTLGYRQQMVQIITNHQSAFTGTLLFVIAFGVFALNAMFKQSGDHPLPIWMPNKNIITNSVQVPIRRVETSSFKAPNIPVPQIRPVPVTLEAIITNDNANDINGQIFAEPARVDPQQVQQLLAKLGHYSGPIDGLIGANTRQAIRQFEHAKFLPESGEISAALVLLLESTLAAAKRNQEKPVNNNSKPLTTASGEGAVITRIQVGLINFGISDISIDGVLGAQTKQAIMEFQKQFNMEVDGIPTTALVRKLESVGALTKG